MKLETLEGAMQEIVFEALKLSEELGDTRIIDLFAPLGMSHNVGLNLVIQQELEGNKSNAETVRDTVFNNAMRHLRERFEDEGEMIDYKEG